MTFLKNKINLKRAMGTKMNRYKLCKFMKDKNTRRYKNKISNLLNHKNKK